MSGEAKYMVEMRIETPRFGAKLVTKMVLVDGGRRFYFNSRATSKPILWRLFIGSLRRRQS